MTNLPIINDTALKPILKQIEWIVTDMDGVWTSGHLLLDGTQSESKLFSARDGIGIWLAHQGGLHTAILTGRISDVVKRRAKELNITTVIGTKVNQKFDGFREFLDGKQLKSNQVLYVGDDIIDIPVFSLVDIAVVPNDAEALTKSFAQAITQARGGEGVIRECVEAILKAQGKYTKILKDHLNITIK